MRNPLNGKRMSRTAEADVEKLRLIRRNARKGARSGNPAIRIPARRVLAEVGPFIGRVYEQDAARRRRADQMRGAR